MKTMKLAMMICVVSAIAITGCSKNNDTPTGTMYSISGNASGSQVVPAVNGNGSGTITGTYNASTGLMTYTTNWSNMTGAPTSAGFYTGASGTAGTAAGSPWTMGSGLTGTGTYSGSMTLTSDQAAQLNGGNMYYSMGTATNAGGEIRGQMSTTPVQ